MNNMFDSKKYRKNRYCNHRNTDLIQEPTKAIRLKYVEQNIDLLKLSKGNKILDIGGNNFKGYCKSHNYEYIMIDLESEQKHGTGGYSGGGLTYNGRDLPFDENSFEVIFVSFMLHHAGSNTIHLLKQIKNISSRYIIICEDLCAIEYPIKWHERCFNHQKNGIYRSDEEWKFLFKTFNLKMIDILNIRLNRDNIFSDPFEYIYRIQFTLTKNLDDQILYNNR